MNTEEPSQPHQAVDPHEVSGDIDSGFLCDLVGVTTQFPQKSGDIEGDNSASVEAAELDLAIDRQEVDPQRTKIPLHKQGLTQMLLLGGLVTIPMGGLGWLMFGNLGSSTTQTQTAPAPAAEVTTAKPEYESDPRFPVVQSKLVIQAQEEQQLLAAAKAQQETEAAKKLAQATPTPTTPTASTTSPAIVPAKVPETTAAPEIVTAKTPTNIRPPILPSPTPTPAPVKIEPVKTVETVSKPAVKPVVIASRSAVIPPTIPTMRVLAPAPTTKASPAPISTPTPQVSWQEATNGAVGVFGGRRESTVAVVSQPSPTQATSSNPSGRVIIAGQNRVASLITPLQVLSGEQSQEVLLNLEQGFVDTQGRMSIPANTKIQAQVTVASNGMLRIGDAKVAIGGVEHAISLGNLMLVGTNNQPLVAELKQFNNGEIARRDMQTALIGGLQGLGQVLTQPNTQTQITTGGAAISTTTSNQNGFGGVVYGATSPLVQQWAQRNQAEIQRLDSNARVWFLPAGSKVSLYTTKPFEIK
jgi:hypothetical protein